MTSKKSTPIAVLRNALGNYEGQEQVFAATVQRSVSWVKKASAGLRAITPNTARQVSMATGVSEKWLLVGDPCAPILERDNATPYTMDSFERWRRANPTSHCDAPYAGLKRDESPNPDASDSHSVAMLTAEVVRTVFAAVESGKGNLAVNDLWKYSKVMTGRYGSPRQIEESENFTRIVGGLIVEAVQAEGSRRSLRGEV